MRHTRFGGTKERAGGQGEPRRFYSVAEVARMLGVSQMTLYREIHAGEFPAVRIRSRYVIPAKALDAMTDAAVADQTMVEAVDFVPGGVVA